MATKRTAGVEKNLEEVAPVIPESLGATPEPAEPVEVMGLDAFILVKWGRKADQGAGFAHHAQKKNLTRLPRADWDRQFLEFQSRPVGRKS